MQLEKLSAGSSPERPRDVPKRVTLACISRVPKVLRASSICHLPTNKINTSQLDWSRFFSISLEAIFPLWDIKQEDVKA